MVYSSEVNGMCCVHQGVAHGAAPIPEEAKWVKAREIKPVFGGSNQHGVEVGFGRKLFKFIYHSFTS